MQKPIHYINAVMMDEVSRNSQVSFSNDIFLNNSHVIPYNASLIRRYDCHINIEVCASLLVVKYIHKCIYKGHDRITMRLGENRDQIK